MSTGTMWTPLLSVPTRERESEGLQRQRGWNPDDIYTIGDGHNDLPMLTAFHGAAPVSAEKGVLAQISKTVDSVEDYINQLLA